MSFSKVTIGKKAPEIVNVVIEIPRGTHHKYEYDDAMDEIKLDRVLHSAVFYPTDYGFIPHTLSDDGDHLDVLVLITDPLFPGCVVEVRPVGILDMEDEAGRDWKIIAVADKDPKMADVKTISDIDKHYKLEIEQFFKEYKELEHKKVKVKQWHPKEEAMNRIEKAMKKYLEETV
jgi:inorganic pyrophosphatase